MPKVDPGHFFSDQLRALRQHLGLTQQQMADRLGCSQNYVAQLEGRTKRSPSGTFLKAFAALERESIYPVNPATEDTTPLREVGAHVATSNAVHLDAGLRADFASVLEMAGDNRDRLGWVRVQLDQMSAVARSWLSPEEVNERARRKAAAMTEESRRRRHYSSTTQGAAERPAEKFR